MPRMTLNDKTVEHLKPVEGKRTFYSDSLLPALSVMVLPTSSKSWLIKYRVPGIASPQQQTLKPDPETGKLLTCGKARKEARKFLEAIQNGERPDLEAKEDKAKAATGMYLIEEVGADWLRWLEQNRDKGTYDNYRGVFNNYILPKLKGRRIDLIKRTELQKIINDRKSEAPGSARTIGKACKSLFNYCIEEAGLIDLDNDPTTKLKTPPTGERDRALSNDEIAVLWSAANRLDLRRATFFRLSLLLANRREELEQMRGEQLDLEGGLWTIPGEHIKNVKRRKGTKNSAMPDRLVPLSPLAVSLIKAMLPTNPTERLFLSTTCGNAAGGVTGKDRLDAAIAAEVEEQGLDPVPHFTTHDLRRSAATGLASLRVEPHIIEAVLGHISGAALGGGTAKVYNRFRYFDQKREALDMWASHIEKLVGGNVVPLRKSA